MVFEMPRVKTPVPWSFCHVRKGLSASNFGLRDPELNLRLDAYHRDMLKKTASCTFPFLVVRTADAAAVENRRLAKEIS